MFYILNNYLGRLMMSDNPLKDLTHDAELMFLWDEYRPGSYLVAKCIMAKAINDLRSGAEISKRMRDHLADGLEQLSSKKEIDKNFAVAFGYKSDKSKWKSHLYYLDFRERYWDKAPYLKLNKTVKADGSEGDLIRLAREFGCSVTTCEKFLKNLKAEYKAMDVYEDFPPPCPPRVIGEY